MCWNIIQFCNLTGKSWYLSWLFSRCWWRVQIKVRFSCRMNTDIPITLEQLPFGLSSLFCAVRRRIPVVPSSYVVFENKWNKTWKFCVQVYRRWVGGDNDTAGAQDTAKLHWIHAFLPWNFHECAVIKIFSFWYLLHFTWLGNGPLKFDTNN